MTNKEPIDKSALDFLREIKEGKFILEERADQGAFVGFLGYLGIDIPIEKSENPEALVKGFFKALKDMIEEIIKEKEDISLEDLFQEIKKRKSILEEKGERFGRLGEKAQEGTEWWKEEMRRPRRIKIE